MIFRFYRHGRSIWHRKIRHRHRWRGDIPTGPDHEGEEAVIICREGCSLLTSSSLGSVPHSRRHVRYHCRLRSRRLCPDRTGPPAPGVWVIQSIQVRFNRPRTAIIRPKD